MAAPLSSIPSLIPLPAGKQSEPDREEDEDRFASLFSPPTPPGSRSATPIFINTRPSIQERGHGRTPSSAGSEFGSFVSVPASDDPLRDLFDPNPEPPGQQPFTPQSLEFFTQFTDGAKSASEKHRHQVLDELLQHEDDPLYFLKHAQPTPAAAGTGTHVPDLLSDLDPLAGPSSLPGGHPSRAQNITQPEPIRPPSIDAPDHLRRSSSSDRNSPTSPRLMRSQSSVSAATISSRWLPSTFTSRSSASEERTPVSALISNAVRALPIASKTIPIPKSPSHPTLHATPSYGSLDATATVKHGTPFAAHVFVPSSGAPGFGGGGTLNPKGFEYDRKRAETASIKLVGRKESTTPVLTVALADAIRAHLPALARLPKTWNLMYSLDQNGISLKTMYTRCEAHMKGALVVVKDSGDAVFGAWIGDGIHVSPGAYYGSGESFLWRQRNGHVQVYKWTGRNDYVALCEHAFISFGGGDGHYGLFLDDTLFEGSSAPCPTFNNEPLCSDGPRKGSTVNFECVGVEVWAMG